jgi:hypothetical protein
MNGSTLGHFANIIRILNKFEKKSFAAFYKIAIRNFLKTRNPSGLFDPLVTI